MYNASRKGTHLEHAHVHTRTYLEGRVAASSVGGEGGGMGAVAATEALAGVRVVRAAPAAGSAGGKLPASDRSRNSGL